MEPKIKGLKISLDKDRSVFCGLDDGLLIQFKREQPIGDCTTCIIDVEEDGLLTTSIELSLTAAYALRQLLKEILPK